MNRLKIKQNLRFWQNAFKGIIKISNKEIKNSNYMISTYQKAIITEWKILKKKEYKYKKDLNNKIEEREKMEVDKLISNL